MAKAAIIALITIFTVSFYQQWISHAENLPVSTVQTSVVVDQQVVSAGVRSIESYVESRPDFVKNPTWISKKTYANGVVRFEVKDLAARVQTNSTPTRFNPGESVAGLIKLDTGGAPLVNCWLEVAPSGGIVEGGVINGWYQEVSKLPSCTTGVVASQPVTNQPSSQPVQAKSRHLTSAEGPLSYKTGDAVAGFIVGKLPQPCQIVKATEQGVLQDGVLNRGGLMEEWKGEFKFPPCQ